MCTRATKSVSVHVTLLSGLKLQRQEQECCKKTSVSFTQCRRSWKYASNQCMRRMLSCHRSCRKHNIPQKLNFTGENLRLWLVGWPSKSQSAKPRTTDELPLREQSIRRSIQLMCPGHRSTRWSPSAQIFFADDGLQSPIMQRFSLGSSSLLHTTGKDQDAQYAWCEGYNGTSK
jgi:hypothetical protein